MVSNLSLKGTICNQFESLNAESCEMFGAILRKNSIIMNIPMYKEFHGIWNSSHKKQ